MDRKIAILLALLMTPAPPADGGIVCRDQVAGKGTAKLVRRRTDGSLCLDINYAMKCVQTRSGPPDGCTYYVQIRIVGFPRGGGNPVVLQDYGLVNDAASCGVERAPVSKLLSYGEPCALGPFSHLRFTVRICYGRPSYGRGGIVSETLLCAPPIQ